MIRINGNADRENINGGCYHRDSYFKRRMKKRVSNDFEYTMVLDFTIHHAEDIDNPSRYRSVSYSDRNYAVVSWVEPGKEFRTDVVHGLLNPQWTHHFRMLLGQSVSYRFLNVEVVRLYSTCDPGTSGGMVVVGRVRIPIPSEIHVKKTGRFGLVRMADTGCRAEGHIVVSLEVKQFDRRG